MRKDDGPYQSVAPSIATVAQASEGNSAGRGMAMGAVVGLFLFVIFAWGLNWVSMKVLVRELTPVWAVALRTWIAVVVLVPAVLLSGQFVVPRRGDLPVVFVIAMFHMVAFAVLMAAGLQYIPAGRAIVLGYTTPLWVAPAAWLFLREPLSLQRIAGIGLGMAGLLLLFEPGAFHWHDGHLILGNALILAAALCWSVSIVYTRAHRWLATPFQLVLWQALLAAVSLTLVAIVLEGPPRVSLSARAMAALIYNGVIGTALGYWAMAEVNKALPAVVTSLGLLGTPVVGLGLSVLLLGERADPTLVISGLLILAGILLGSGVRGK